MNKILSLALPAPDAQALPLVFDSPHSGMDYPGDAGIIAPRAALMSTCDAWVDELWSEAPAHGGALLAARFLRSYIDVNRSIREVDSEICDGILPFNMQQSDRLSRGMGLMWRFAAPGVPMYADKLAADEVVHRIETYYKPYHATLEKLLDERRRAFGRVWHVNCHSMKPVGNAMSPDDGALRPDVVVSDCDGTSCEQEFTEWTAARFRELGYEVRINYPFHGGQIVKRHGDPRSGRHSLQIEVNRRLYMDHDRIVKTDGFDKLKNNIGIVIESLTDYIRSKLVLK